MTTVQTSSPAATCVSPRISTLGVAKQDCLTCTTQDEQCDRSRPHCSTCQSKPRSCEGYAPDLVWKNAMTPRKKPKASVLPAKKSSGASTSSTSQPQQRELKFVTAQLGTKKRKKPAKTPYSSSALFSKFALNTASQPAAAASPSKSSGSSDSHSTPSPPHDNPLGPQPESWEHEPWSLAQPTLPLYGGFVFPPEQLPEGFLEANGQSFTSEDLAAMSDQNRLFEASPISTSMISAGVDTSAYDDPVDEDIFELLDQVPPSVMFQSMTRKYQDILDIYNTNYCVVPLSTDCPSNPFRVSPSLIDKYPFLLHGVLAISSRHLAKRDNSIVLEEQAHNHWSTSLQLLGTATYSNSDFLPLLDTVLVLANFESMQSAYNMVNMHLDGARKMLQEAGLSAWSHYNPRLRAQIAMLVWWDVTVSLVARRKPRLPGSYIDALLNYDGDESDGWSSFTLNGCPLPFISAMSQLANLAAIYEQTKQMEYTLFDHAAVDAILERVKAYADIDQSLPTCNETNMADALRNRHHCIEAWRHGILLYAQRVFKPVPNEAGVQQISHLSRVILDSVRCIPPTETIQKQVLLPVFLAAAEVGNQWNRDFVREYCRHWTKISNFDQFETVGRLLEDIWAGWAEDTRDVYWWGVKVPAAGSLESGDVPMSRMLQLG